MAWFYFECFYQWIENKFTLVMVAFPVSRWSSVLNRWMKKKNSVQIDIIIFLLINYDSIIFGCVKRLLIDMKWVMWTMKADWTTTRHSVKCTHRFPCVPSTNSIPSIIELIKLNEHMPFSPGPLSMITFLFFPLYVFAQIDCWLIKWNLLIDRQRQGNRGFLLLYYLFC